MKSQFPSLQVLARTTMPLSASSPARFNRFAPPHSRRKGVALVYATLGLGAFLGTTALVVDMGSLYTRRAQAQRAADAAALAGAWDLSSDSDGSAARTTAVDYAKKNGYDTDKGATVIVNIKDGNLGIGSQIEVVVQKPEQLFFMPAARAILGLADTDPTKNATTSIVGAHAVAETEFGRNPVSISIDNKDYGKADDDANPSVFGVDALYTYGDAFSTRVNNEGDPNEGRGADKVAGADFKGYEYKLNIPNNFAALNDGSSEVQLEIFDPDCYVSPANASNSLLDWDELHVGHTGSDIPTITTFEIFAPNDTLRENPIASATFGGDANDPDDVDGNLKWTTPQGFIFDINAPGRGPGDYVVRVKGGAGVSENGFQFRAGKKRDDLTTLRDDADYATWKEQYDAGGRDNGAAGNGTSFSATGKTPFNFTKSGIVEVALGFVPSESGSGSNAVPVSKVDIEKFDTDVGAKNIAYYYVPKGGTQQVPIDKAGVLAADGTWLTPPDTFSVSKNPNGSGQQTDVPSYPAEGATWYARYEAGAYDTSTWMMSFNGSDSKDRRVRLID